MSETPAVGSRPHSGSIRNPDYWWYRARSDLLRVVFTPYLEGRPTILDVGSADGPSVAWMRDLGTRVPVDVDPAGLRAGGVCASALALPFPDGSFDAVTAFDVVEHFADDAAMVAEVRRIVRPGGRFLASVPAYRWAWSSHDVLAGHHRRYTRPSIIALLERAGFTVDRATYAFAGTFPLFAADRMRSRLLRRPAERADATDVGTRAERVLMKLCRIDARALAKRDLPFGSSILVAARAG